MRIGNGWLPVAGWIFVFATRVLCAAEARAAASQPFDGAATAAKLQKLFDQLEAQDRKLPRDTFDPAAVIEQVGRDPQKLFEYVRDRTCWVPYQGVLRGPIGVLMDGIGNSLDRSLLLAELLRTTGQTVRLVHAELTPAQAGELLARIRPARLRSEEKKSVDAAPNTHDTEAQGLFEDAVARVASHTPRLARLMNAAGREGDTAAASIAAISDHWWVERQERGAWVPMDVLLPDAQPGKALATARQTIAPNPKAPGTFPLDGKLWHELRLRVIIERADKTGLKEFPVLDTTLRPAELLGREIVLQHVPMNWPSEIAFKTRTEMTAWLKKSALAEKEWLPTLAVGKERVAQSSFTDAGMVNDTPNINPAAKVGDAVRSSFGNLIGSAAGDPSTQKKADSMLTAEWVEFDFRSPGLPTRTIRRELFDLIGPAARAAKAAPAAITEPARTQRAFALLDETTILPQICRFSSEFIVHLWASELLASRSAALELAAEPDSARRKLLAERIEYTALRSPLGMMALERTVLSRSGKQFYLDRPNLVTCRVESRIDSLDVLVNRELIDVVYNYPAILRGPGGQGAAEAFQVRLEQGVADTVAELLALGSGEDGAENTVTIFDLADAAAVEAILIRRRDDAAFKGLPCSADVRARIEQDLAAGYAVVVPARPVAVRGGERLGWWRVDEKTGETIGVMDSGFHQNTTEQTVLTTRTQLAYRYLKGLRSLGHEGLRRQIFGRGISAATLASQNEFIAKTLNEINDLLAKCVWFGLD